VALRCPRRVVALHQSCVVMVGLPSTPLTRETRRRRERHKRDEVLQSVLNVVERSKEFFLF